MSGRRSCSKGARAERSIANALKISGIAAVRVPLSGAVGGAMMHMRLRRLKPDRLAAFTNDPFWVSHARNLNSMFEREESVQLSKVREFSKRYLTDKHDTMLYMFSGPDFLYATSFFPNASTYVLAGLEPVGAVPELTR